MAQFNETTQQDDLIEHISEEKDEEQQIFRNTLDALGATNLYDDEETIRALWTKLRETDPSLLRQFEGFIGKVTEEIKRSKSDHRSIEAANSKLKLRKRKFWNKFAKKNESFSCLSMKILFLN